MNRALSTLRLVYNYAERCGYTVPNPVKHVTFFRKSGRPESSLRRRSGISGRHEPTLRDIARIILDTGMRPEEVFRIETANLDLSAADDFQSFWQDGSRQTEAHDDRRSLLNLEDAAILSKSRYVFSSLTIPKANRQRSKSTRCGHPSGQDRALLSGSTISGTLTHRGLSWRAWIFRRFLRC